MKRDDQQISNEKLKKNRGCLWVTKRVIIIFAGLLLLVVALNFRLPPSENSPLVRVAPETTFITEPLKANGDVDYVAAMNRLRYVPPNDNAFVDIFKIIGPTLEGQLASDELFRLLGIERLPETGDYLDNGPFGHRKPTPENDLSSMLDGVSLEHSQVDDLTQSVPVTISQFPKIEAWFEANERHLVAVRKAVQKPGFYGTYAGESVMGVMLPQIQEMRGLGRSLLRSALIRLGRGDTTGTIDDGIAFFKLGNHIGREGFMIENLVGVAIQSMGHRVIGLSIDSGNCTEVDLKRLETELELNTESSLVMKPQMRFERFMTLDSTISIARGRFAPAKNEKELPLSVRLWISSVDNETTMIELNKFFDEMEGSLEGVTFLDSAATTTSFEAKMRKREKELSSAEAIVTSLIGGRKGRAKISSVFLLNMLAPALEQVQLANCRSMAQMRMSRIAVALERYRKANNDFPETLDSLVPTFLKELPCDPFGGKPFVYRRNDAKSFTLYSLYYNQKDDGGNFDEYALKQTDYSWAPTIRTVKDWIEANVEKDDE